MDEAKLHLLKLCVGIDRPEDLAAWQAHKALKGQSKFWHITRMWPRRGDELLKGGSLYWVMKGAITCRQGITGLEEVRGEDGIRRCKIILHHELVRVATTPRRPFQGWRYLEGGDAPPDHGEIGGDLDELPEELLEAMSRFGVM